MVVYVGGVAAGLCSLIFPSKIY